MPHWEPLAAQNSVGTRSMVITGLHHEHHEFGDSQSKVNSVLPELVQTQRLQSSSKFRDRGMN